MKELKDYSILDIETIDDDRFTKAKASPKPLNLARFRAFFCL